MGAAFSMLCISALFVLLVLSVLPAQDQPTFAAEGPSIPAAAPPSSVATRPAEPADENTQTTKTRKAVTPVAPSARKRAVRTARKEAAAKRPVRSRERARFTPARAFGWVEQARAAYYQVTFFRNGRRFYRARARGASLTLPGHIRFTEGAYRWTVRAAIPAQNGVRLGDPIVDSTFTIRGS